MDTPEVAYVPMKTKHPLLTDHILCDPYKWKILQSKSVYQGRSNKNLQNIEIKLWRHIEHQHIFVARVNMHNKLGLLILVRRERETY
jgi:hypothetical protein